MSTAPPMWPQTRMRLLSLTLDATGTPILCLVRLDVTTDLVLGCRTKRVVSGFRDLEVSQLGPFEGERLMRAIWQPHCADTLVVVSPEATEAMPGAVKRPVLCILVPRAWCRLMAVAPSNLLDLCWHRGGGCSSDTPWELGGTAETGDPLLARMLTVLLHQASPDELVAYSRTGR